MAGGIAMLATPFGKPLFSTGLEMFCYSAVSLICLKMIVRAIEERMEAEERLETTRENSDAGDALSRWRLENLDKDFSDPIGRALLLNQIEKRKRFLKTHSYIEDAESHLKYLENLLR